MSLGLRIAASKAVHARAVMRRAASTHAALPNHHDVVIVGGGAAGIATAASLRQRGYKGSIGLVEPAAMHFYQPAWTFVGSGNFLPETTGRPMGDVIPSGVTWHKSAATGFAPEKNTVILGGGHALKYDRLVVAPGLHMDWSAIPGLEATLGANGVCSNYRRDLAPYTYKNVLDIASKRGGRAVFTQPPVPLKCPGAPQKAVYLSADRWDKAGVLKNVDIQFCNAGGTLFGVPAYIPALMEYVARYGVHLNFGETLVGVDGPGRTATFKKALPEGKTEVVVRPFDMLHVVPPQRAPDFIRSSPLADAGGWVDVDQHTLRHKRYTNVYGLGDACNTPNSKTAAAARKQAPVVAHNILLDSGSKAVTGEATYDGYGACPLTVEQGKIVLAEFTYGGKLAPTFPPWVLEGTKATSAAWALKEHVLPTVYWELMLKGREWLAGPT